MSRDREREIARGIQHQKDAEEAAKAAGAAVSIITIALCGVIAYAAGWINIWVGLAIAFIALNTSTVAYSMVRKRML